MKLYIGGMAQGKLTYVMEENKMQEQSCIAFGESCSMEEPFHKAIIYQLHFLLRRLPGQTAQAEEYLNQILDKNPDVLIICDEVGMGVVPQNEEERNYREKVGRSCCYLAKRAERVERILCGIGSRLC